jgi:hypothetical protein
VCIEGFSRNWYWSVTTVSNRFIAAGHTGYSYFVEDGRKMKFRVGGTVFDLNSSAGI